MKLRNITEIKRDITPPIETSEVWKEVSSPEGPLAILKNISLIIDRRQALAILGPSGSGKTTLLGLLAGFDDPTRGTINLLGYHLADLDESCRAKLRAGKIGFVFQNFNLLPHLTAAENIRLGVELAGLDSVNSRVRDALSAVSLTERARHFPDTLSGGEQQRVAIARAFASDPVILLADEPTGNLDTVTGAQIARLLLDLQAERGTTIVLATHDQHLADRCNRKCELIAGELHER